MPKTQFVTSRGIRPIRVLIVDDSVVVRKILSEVLRDDPAIEVVGIASNGVTALQRINQLRPDVVTLDVEMPEMDGLATLREIKRQYPRTRVIMCSAMTERGAGVTLEALSLGADDYIAKGLSQNGEDGRAQIREQLTPKIKQFLWCGAAVETPASPVPNPVAAVRAGEKRRALRMPFRAVAIGSSTGGPNALAEVIPMLPREFPVPIFLVQHMPPVFTRLLAERLQSQSKVKVMEGSDGMTVEPGCVYVAPGDHHMCVAREGRLVRLRLNQDPMENSCRPAVDVLFRSVAELYGGATISVILTGMGQDGLRGVERLHQMGGYVIAQDEASSVVWGMPGYVVRTGFADSVCDLKEVAPEILRQFEGTRH